MWIDDNVAEILRAPDPSKHTLLQKLHDTASAKVDEYAEGFGRAVHEYELSLKFLAAEERPTGMELRLAREWALCAVRSPGAGSDALPATPTQHVLLVWVNAEREIAEARESLTSLRALIKSIA
jgi:hypothetical protein